MPRFAVLRRRGPAWDASLPMPEQEAWAEHAAFMNALATDGFVVLGGPLGDGERILLVIDADDEDSVRRRLASDPWTPMHLLVIDSVERWNILLDHGAG